ILERLETAEIDPALDFTRLARDVGQYQLDRDGKPAGLSTQRGAEPFGREQRWIDAAGELPQIVDRLIRVVPELFEDGTGLAVRRGQGETNFHLEGDQVLLRAVVQVAFDPSPLLVLGRHQPLARSAEGLEPRPQ